MLLADEQARQTSIGLWGPPGMGKTQMFEQVAEEIGAKVAVFLTATMDPTDVVGVPHPDGNVTRFLPPEAFMALTEEADYKGPMIALFDDMPACIEQVFAADDCPLR
jgi:MoxR-like ATPase